MAPIAAVNADLTIAVSLSRQRGTRRREPEPGVTAEWLNRMVRSTSALFDVTPPGRCSTGRPRGRC